jgi:hypothetical protein
VRFGRAPGRGGGPGSSCSPVRHPPVGALRSGPSSRSWSGYLSRAPDSHLPSLLLRHLRQEGLPSPSHIANRDCALSGASSMVPGSLGVSLGAPIARMLQDSPLSRRVQPSDGPRRPGEARWTPRSSGRQRSRGLRQRCGSPYPRERAGETVSERRRPPHALRVMWSKTTRAILPTTNGICSSRSSRSRRSAGDRSSAGPRETLDAVFYVLKTGCQ